MARPGYKPRRSRGEGLVAFEQSDGIELRTISRGAPGRVANRRIRRPGMLSEPMPRHMKAMARPTPVGLMRPRMRPANGPP